MTWFGEGGCHGVQSGVNAKACYLNELRHFGSDSPPHHFTTLLSGMVVILNQSEAGAMMSCLE